MHAQDFFVASTPNGWEIHSANQVLVGRVRAMKLRTPQEAKAELERKGVSVSAWAVANGFSPNLVHMILAGQRKPTRGQSHNIAVKLGIKRGETCDDARNALAA